DALDAEALEYLLAPRRGIGIVGGRAERIERECVLVWEGGLLGCAAALFEERDPLVAPAELNQGHAFHPQRSRVESRSVGPIGRLREDRLDTVECLLTPTTAKRVALGATQFYLKDSPARVDVPQRLGRLLEEPVRSVEAAVARCSSAAVHERQPCE